MKVEIYHDDNGTVTVVADNNKLKTCSNKEERDGPYGSGTVSYTHLDVYKRQHTHRSYESCDYKTDKHKHISYFAKVNKKFKKKLK